MLNEHQQDEIGDGRKTKWEMQSQKWEKQHAQIFKHAIHSLYPEQSLQNEKEPKLRTAPDSSHNSQNDKYATECCNFPS